MIPKNQTTSESLVHKTWMENQQNNMANRR